MQNSTRRSRRAPASLQQDARLQALRAFFLQGLDALRKQWHLLALEQQATLPKTPPASKVQFSSPQEAASAAARAVSTTDEASQPEQGLHTLHVRGKTGRLIRAMGGLFQASGWVWASRRHSSALCGSGLQTSPR